MTEMCEKCHINPRDTMLKKPLCTQCGIQEMKAFREKVEKELRKRMEEKEMSTRIEQMEGAGMTELFKTLQNSSNEELLPCPFCSSNNIICPLPWIISCDSCGFEFYPPSHFGEGLTDKQR